MLAEESLGTRRNQIDNLNHFLHPWFHMENIPTQHQSESLLDWEEVHPS